MAEQNKVTTPHYSRVMKEIIFVALDTLKLQTQLNFFIMKHASLDGHADASVYDFFRDELIEQQENIQRYFQQLVDQLDNESNNDNNKPNIFSKL